MGVRNTSIASGLLLAPFACTLARVSNSPNDQTRDAKTKKLHLGGKGPLISDFWDSLGAYSLGGYSLGQPILDLGNHSLDWEATVWEATVSGNRFWISGPKHPRRVG